MDKSQVVDACRREADRFYQGYQTDDVNNPRSRYIIECMDSKGFEFDISPPGCDGRYSLSTQAACYVPTGWMARMIERVLGN